MRQWWVYLLRAAVTAFLTLIASIHPSEAAPFQTTADFLLGTQSSKVYDGSRLNVGTELFLLPRAWPVGMTFFASRSSDVRGCPTECGDLHEKLTQAGLGLRREWGVRLRPSLSGGLAWSERRTDIDPSYDDAGYDQNTGYTERATGWWVGASALLQVASPVHVGGGLRYSRVNQGARGYDFWYQTWSVYGSMGVTWPRPKE